VDGWLHCLVPAFFTPCTSLNTGLSNGVYPGYRQDQRDVLDHLANEKIDNTIVLTGDIHTHWVRCLAPSIPCLQLACSDGCIICLRLLGTGANVPGRLEVTSCGPTGGAQAHVSCSAAAAMPANPAARPRGTLSLFSFLHVSNMFCQLHSIEFQNAPCLRQANDVPKYPCSREANYSYNPDTGAGSLAVEFVSSAITSGYK